LRLYCVFNTLNVEFVALIETSARTWPGPGRRLQWKSQRACVRFGVPGARQECRPLRYHLLLTPSNHFSSLLWHVLSCLVLSCHAISSHVKHVVTPYLPSCPAVCPPRQLYNSTTPWHVRCCGCTINPREVRLSLSYCCFERIMEWHCVFHWYDSKKANRGPRLTPEGLRPRHPRRGGRRVGNAGQHGKRAALGWP
jgi:hypothetical protein